MYVSSVDDHKNDLLFCLTKAILITHIFYGEILQMIIKYPHYQVYWLN